MVDGEVQVEIAGQATIRSVLDALEALLSGPPGGPFGIRSAASAGRSCDSSCAQRIGLTIPWTRLSRRPWREA